MNKSNKSRNAYMLQGPLATKGYDWWWHSFTGVNRTTGKIMLVVSMENMINKL